MNYATGSVAFQGRVYSAIRASSCVTSVGTGGVAVVVCMSAVAGRVHSASFLERFSASS